MPPPIYLDHHATTPCDPRVVEAMLPYFTTHFGNASSRTHAHGWRALEAVEAARAHIAALLGAPASRDIIFTSGATESINIALQGFVERATAVAPDGPPITTHIVTLTTEHSAVLETARALERRGAARATFLPVEPDGLLHPPRLVAALTEILAASPSGAPARIILSVHAVNNELGVIQPLAEIVAAARAAAPGVVIHVDAAQAPGRIALDIARLGLDLVSLSAHKFYGPKGIGALVLGTPAGRRAIAPIQFGGGHERGLRPGTLNVPAIVGFGEAARIARAELDTDTARIAALRDDLWARLRAALPTARLNGSPTARVAANLNICFPGCPGAQLVAALRGLSLSTGSACTAATAPSHVLRAIGLTPTDADSSLRISLGRFTTQEEIEAAAEQIIAAVREHTIED